MATDILEMLVEALTLRIEERLIEKMEQRMNRFFEDSVRDFNVEADEVKGLDRWFESAFEEATRNLKIDADNIEDLDKVIGEAVEQTLKDGNFNIEFSA